MPTQSAHINRRDVCAVTGLLPSAQSKQTVSELFLRGTEPTEKADSWFANDGKLLLPREYTAWCVTADNNNGARVRAAPRITSPRANARYEIDSVVPRAQQMIELSANVGENVRWFVNGAPQTQQADGRFFWALSPGSWTVSAIGAAGTAEEKISVE